MYITSSSARLLFFLMQKVEVQKGPELVGMLKIG